MMRGFAFAGALACAACWTDSSKPPVHAQPRTEDPATYAPPRPPPHVPTEIERQMDELDVLADRMCGCTDASCAQSVSVDLNTWGQALATNSGSGERFTPDDEQQKRMTETAQRLASCMSRAMTLQTPPQPTP